MKQVLYNTINDAFQEVKLVSNARKDCLTKILLGITKSKSVPFPAIAD
jgi:hypothetical protein